MRGVETSIEASIGPPPDALILDVCRSRWNSRGRNRRGFAASSVRPMPILMIIIQGKWLLLYYNPQQTPRPSIPIVVLYRNSNEGARWLSALIIPIGTSIRRTLIGYPDIFYRHYLYLHYLHTILLSLSLLSLQSYNPLVIHSS